MTYTQLLEASRPRHKLTCQIPEKTRKAVSSWTVPFQHLVCISPKRTAGSAGAGGGRERAREWRKEDGDIGKTRTHGRTPGEIRHVIVRPLVRGQACDLTWPTLCSSALTRDLFCRGLDKHRPPAHNNEPLTRQGLTAIPVHW